MQSFSIKQILQTRDHIVIHLDKAVQNSSQSSFQSRKKRKVCKINKMTFHSVVEVDFAFIATLFHGFTNEVTD